MSMSSWDVSAVSNGENGSFDPSMGFGANVNSVDFDPSRLQNNQTSNLQFQTQSQPSAQQPQSQPPPQQQQQQQMQNGNFRHASPAVPNQMFQTSSVVPSKRPHSDYSASPSQVSRSHTPQQGQGAAFPGYQTGVNGQQAPQQFQHLQQTNSSTASPSPVMQNQNFNQQAIGPRMQSGSPAPFSPAGQGFGQQGGPQHMDQGGQFEANGNHPQMQQGAQNANPQTFSPTPGNTGLPMQGSPQQGFNAKTLTPEQQRMLYENRMRQFPPNSALGQQQRQQMNAMNQMNIMGQMPPGAAPSNQGMSPQQQQQQQQQQHMAARAQQAQQMQRMMLPSNPDAFARTVAQFMQARGMPFNSAPQICGRSTAAVTIYTCVMKAGGSRRISASNQWPRVAQTLGFQPQQLQQATQELSTYWQTNLFPYEMTLLQNLQNQQRPGSGGQMPMPGRGPMENGHMQGSPPPNQAQQQPPPQHQPQQHQHPQHPQQQQQPLPQGSPTSLQKRRQSSAEGGGLTLPGSQDPNAYQANGMLVRDGQGQMASGGFPPNAMYGPKSAKGMPPGAMPVSAESMGSAGPMQSAFPLEQVKPPDEVEPVSVPEELRAKAFNWELDDGIGGILVDDGGGGQSLPPETFTHQAQHIAMLIEKFGVDILDIIVRLKSGLPGEVRWALDFLSVSSVRREAPLFLQHCEDLVDSLLDVAEDTLDQLAHGSDDEPEATRLPSYEELVRSCEREESELRDVPAPGSREFHLENLTERLLCVTSLLRTWSSIEMNVPAILADGSLIRFLNLAVRYLSTRHLLLRSSECTLSFVKDVVTLLSNVSLQLEFANKEEATHIVQFLLVFAPEPLCRPLQKEIQFPQFKPAIHHYLPLAVDVLAKILAHGDPNRGYLKSLFLADCTNNGSQDLLTRSFGLAISVVPCEIYRAGLRLQLKQKRNLDSEEKSEAQPENKPKSAIMAQAKAAANARRNSTSTSGETSSAQLRQLRFQSKLDSKIEDILNDAVVMESPSTLKEIQLLGPGKHPTGKWTAKLPCLVSGLLAADILLGIIPNTRSEIIRSWTESSDGLILRLQKFVVNARHAPGWEPSLFEKDEGNASRSADARPTSAREDFPRPQSSGGGSLFPTFGFLPNERQEEEDADSSVGNGDRPGSSGPATNGDRGGPLQSPREAKMRQPSSEQEAVSMMELDALTRSTRILRRLVQRTSKASRSARAAAAAAAAAAAVVAATNTSTDAGISAGPAGVSQPTAEGL